jgi:hypothetical protein
MHVKLNSGLLRQKKRQNSTKQGLFHRQIRFKKLRKKLVKSYIWSLALCGAETGTLR